MLTLYLPARGQPRWRPSIEAIERWLESLTQSQLIVPLNREGEDQLQRLLALIEKGGPFGPENALKMSPGLGIMSLFDQDARDQLLPAELSFEQLKLELAPTPTFIPLGSLEIEITCLHCGDEIHPQIFEHALNALSFVPLEEVTVFCRSCDATRHFKELSYDREVAFACTWLTLEECGSSRLNPVLLKAWGDTLGAPLTMLVDQHDPELDWQGGDERTLAGIDHELLLTDTDQISFFEQGIKPSRALHDHRKRSAQRLQYGSKRGVKKTKRGRTYWDDL